jgi:hypothetical protein
MVADQAAGDGTVHYAVSTDDRTTWSVIKEGSGVRPIVRDNSGTWQYNSQASTTITPFSSVSSITYADKVYNFGSDDTFSSFVFASDGYNVYSTHASNTNRKLKQHTLTTAYDLSTASYVRELAIPSSGDTPAGLGINTNGTKLYLVGQDQNHILEYVLSTAYDLSTASLNYTYNLADNFGAGGQARGIAFSNDGTKLYIVDRMGRRVDQYSMSTAFDISTLSYASKNLSTNGTNPWGISFNGDGTSIFIVDYNTTIEKWNLSTAFDLSTASYHSNITSLSNIKDVYYGAETGKLYLGRFADSGSSDARLVNDGIDEYNAATVTTSYSTSTTWTDATTNDEFYALQEALGATSVNRMDKTQLDAVTDPNHYTLGDTLDLAIALRTDTASASTPTADGVTINYDAASLNQGAVLGTDYDYDFPDSTTVRVTSNAAQNLKIRVV